MPDGHCADPYVIIIVSTCEMFAIEPICIPVSIYYILMEFTDELSSFYRKATLYLKVVNLTKSYTSVLI